MDSVSISVVLRKQRQLVNGCYPIKLRIIYNRKSDYLSLPLNIKDNLSAELYIKNSPKSLKACETAKAAKPNIEGFIQLSAILLRLDHI